MTLQPTAALPVDAEAWWIPYLRGAFVGRPEFYAQDVYFGRSVPSTRRKRMVIVRRDGGSVTGLYDFPRVAFDVWGDPDKPEREVETTNLASLVVALALKAPLADAGVTHVRHLSGPNAVPDESGQPRRLCLIEATHRAVVLT